MRNGIKLFAVACVLCMSTACDLDPSWGAYGPGRAARRSGQTPKAINPCIKPPKRLRTCTVVLAPNPPDEPKE